MAKRVIIVGGVAGGMSCAARLKRLDDSLDVVVFEKGADVSFANCGMPYYIGGVITNRSRMAVQTPQGLTTRYGLDVRTRHEVTQIDRAAQTVTAVDLDSGATVSLTYDTLVLAPGAAPIRPPLPGADGARVFVLNDLADMDRIAEVTATSQHACVIGAGFIGLELVENFKRRGLKVTLVEMLDQVLAPLDPEMAVLLHHELSDKGVAVRLSARAESIDAGGRVTLSDGHVIDSDLVCLSVGVRPTTDLAAAAGLALGPKGHLCVDERMRTSDPAIYAVGDAIQVKNLVSGADDAIPLAGPANRQGRIAADNICGRDSRYRMSQGTAIVQCMTLAAASTGLNERQLKALGWEYEKITIFPTNHPSYYPGACMLSVKLLFAADGRIYGAQVVGADGVAEVIDVFAVAIRGGMTVEDLEHLELAYSPQWGSAKHAVNMAGFVALNVLKGDSGVIHPEEVAGADVLWLDVREPAETRNGVIAGSLLIPLGQLRDRVDELPRDREIGLICAAGLRAYIALRFLRQRGFRCRVLNGGFINWRNDQAAKRVASGQ